MLVSLTFLKKVILKKLYFFWKNYKIRSLVKQKIKDIRAKNHLVYFSQRKKYMKVLWTVYCDPHTIKKLKKKFFFIFHGVWSKDKHRDITAKWSAPFYSIQFINVHHTRNISESSDTSRFIFFLFELIRWKHIRVTLS